MRYLQFLLPPTPTGKMKIEDLSKLAAGLAAPDFKAIEPHLMTLDKHLTLRSYVDGYAINEADTKIWITIRSNKVANEFLKRGSLVNLSRWFTFIEETHPEIQEEVKAKDEAEKAKRAAASKAGASYNMALQDTDKGVVTRFPPEPSYVLIKCPKLIYLPDLVATFISVTLKLRCSTTTSHTSFTKAHYSSDSMIQILLKRNRSFRTLLFKTSNSWASKQIKPATQVTILKCYPNTASA